MASRKKDANQLPPGIELQFDHDFPDDCRSPFAALVLAVHWATVQKTTLRTYNKQTNKSTSHLPESWTQKIATDPSNKPTITLVYKNSSEKLYKLVIQELTANGFAAVVSTHIKPGQDVDTEDPDATSELLTFDMKKFIDVEAVKSGERGPGKVFKSGELEVIGEEIKTRLYSDVDVEEVEIETGKTPYDSNLNPEPPKVQSPLQEPSPLRLPPRGIGMIDPNPFSGIGRSDLDPFGGPQFGGGIGGMLMDPRGFRRPNLPQGLPPGARFDPIGPLGGGGAGRGAFPAFPGMGGGGGGGPRLPFGFPDPDHERMPRGGGYDEMFM